MRNYSSPKLLVKTVKPEILTGKGFWRPKMPLVLRLRSDRYSHSTRANDEYLS